MAIKPRVSTNKALKKKREEEYEKQKKQQQSRSQNVGPDSAGNSYATETKKSNSVVTSNTNNRNVNSAAKKNTSGAKVSDAGNNYAKDLTASLNQARKATNAAKGTPSNKSTQRKFGVDPTGNIGEQGDTLSRKVWTENTKNKHQDVFRNTFFNADDLTGLSAKEIREKASQQQVSRTALDRLYNMVFNDQAEQRRQEIRNTETRRRLMESATPDPTNTREFQDRWANRNNTYDTSVDHLRQEQEEIRKQMERYGRAKEAHTMPPADADKEMDRLKERYAFYQRNIEQAERARSEGKITTRSMMQGSLELGASNDPNYQSMVDKGRLLASDVSASTGDFEKDNILEHAQDAIQNQRIGGGISGGAEGNLREDELNTLLYYIGKEDWTSAGNYWDSLERKLNERYNKDYRAPMNEQMAENAPLLSLLYSGVEGLGSGAGYAATLGGMLTGQDVDPNSAAFMASTDRSAISEGYSNVNARNFGAAAEAVFGKDARGFGEWLGQQFAGAVLSSVDMGVDALAGTLLTDAFGGRALSAAERLTAINRGRWATMIPRVAGDTAQDVLERGGTPAQAASYAAIAATIEYISEQMPFEKIQEAITADPQTFLQTAFAFMAAAGAEGMEEIVSEVGGNFVDAVVMGDKSEFNQHIRDLMEQGMSEEEATSQAMIQYYLINPANAFVGGFMAGGGMSLGGRVVHSALTGDQFIRTGGLKVKEQRQVQSIDNTVTDAFLEGTMEDAKKTARDNAETILGNENVLRNLAGETRAQEILNMEDHEAQLDAVQDVLTQHAMESDAMREKASEQEQKILNLVQDAKGKTQESILKEFFGSTAGKVGNENAIQLFRTVKADRDVDVTDFARSYQEAYLTGLSNGELNPKRNNILTPQEMSMAYRAGVADSATYRTADMMEAENTVVLKEGAGLLNNAYTKNISKKDYNMLNRFGKTLGSKVELYQYQGDGQMGWRDGDGTMHIAVGEGANPIAVTLAHESTHRMQQISPKMYAEYRDAAVQARAKNYPGGIDALISEYKHRYRFQNLNSVELMDEVACDYTRELILHSEKFAEIVNGNLEQAKTIRDTIRDLMDKIKNAFGKVDRKRGNLYESNEVEEFLKKRGVTESFEDIRKALKRWDKLIADADRRVKASSEKRGSGEVKTRNSIEIDAYGNKYVNIEEDILEGVPEEKWADTVKEYLDNKFHGSIYITDSNSIALSNLTYNEIYNSDYSDYLRRRQKRGWTQFKDKLRMMRNADEILRAAKDWINESPKHKHGSRKKGFIDAGVGTVLIRVGKNDYVAQVIVFGRKRAIPLLYDIVGIDPTIIETNEKPEARDAINSTSLRSSGNSTITQSSEESKSDIEELLESAEEVDTNDSESIFNAGGIRCSVERDTNTLEFLNNQEYVTVYRAMQVIDGKLYPPMAAKVFDEEDVGKKGARRQLVDPTEIDVWYRSDERPDLIDPKTGKWKLDKANGSTIEAAYNPYFHTSRSPLNDQFSSAYDRPNLVVVEGIIPKSELTSGYKAEYAKDSVGETKWHAGPVASKLKGEKARRVFLSRWFKANRIVSDAEVAGEIAKILKGEDIAIPSNVVTPSLLEELQKRDVKIEDTIQEKKRLSVDSDGRSLSAEQIAFFNDSKIRDEKGNLKTMWHGTENDFNVFNFSQGGKNGSAEGFGIYLADSKEVTSHYGGRQIESYVNITKPAYSDKKTITVSQLRKLIKATAEAEAREIAEDYGGNVKEALRDTWVSNYTYTYDKSIEASYDEVARSILRLSGSDMEVIQEVMSGMAIRDYEKAEPFYDLLTETLGFDGFSTNWKNDETGKSYQIVLAFRSEQIKRVDNKNPTSNKDIRFSVEDNLNTQIDNVLSNHYDRYNHVYFGNTARSLRKILGLQNLPMLMSNNHVYSTSVSEARARAENRYNRNTNYHNIEDVVRHLPEYLEKPRAIIKSNTDPKDMSFVVVIDEKDGNDPIFVAIKPYGNGNYYSVELDSNVLLSVYGKESFINYINKANNEGRILWVEKQKNNQHRNTKRVQFPNNITKTDYTRNLTRFRELVKQGNVNNRIFKNTENGTDALPKTSYSIESPNDADMAALERENSRLRMRVDNLKEQTRITKQKHVLGVHVNKVARQLIKSFDGTVDVQEIQPELQRLYDFMISGTYTDEGGKTQELTYENVRDLSEDIARKIVDSAEVVDDDAYQTYAGLRQRMRSMKIHLTDDIAADVSADYNDFRKSQMGRLNMVKDSYSNVDSLYKDLMADYPEFFDDLLAEGDQLRRIAEVADIIFERNTVNPYDQYYDQAVNELANDIQDRFWDVPEAPPTLADKARAGAKESKRLAKFADRQQKSYERKLSRQAAENDARIERYKAALQRSRDARANDYRKMIEKNLSDRAKRSELREARELRGKIVRHAKELSTKLLRPNDKKHIPQDLRNAVAKALSIIDLSSKIDKDTGKPRQTLKTTEWEELRKAYKTILENKDDSDMVIDPIIMELIEEVESYDQPIANLDSRQLRNVWNLVRAIESSVSTAGKMLSDSRYQSIREFADELLEENRNKDIRRILAVGKSEKSDGKSLVMDVFDPYTYFHMLGKTGEHLYRKLRDAQDAQRLMREDLKRVTEKIFTAKQVKEWENAFDKIALSSGETLTLTKAQEMELYILAKRDDARRHLLGDGIMQPTVSQAKVKRDGRFRRLTEGDLQIITGMLTPEQVKVADQMQAVMANQMADYGNKATMEVFGYEKFNDEHYWPMHVAQEAKKQDSEKGRNSEVAINVENMGMAKPVALSASNALDLGSAFDSYFGHWSEMERYASYLSAIKDVNRIFNYKYRDEFGVATGRTVKELMEKAIGPGAGSYWLKLLDDLQNGLPDNQASTIERAAFGPVGNIRGAAVAGNIRVILQQPGAAVRALLVMNPGDMTKGLVKGVTAGNGWKKALKYSPIAMQKDAGGFDINKSMSVRQEALGPETGLSKMNDALAKGAGVADAVTWGRIWNAAEWQVARTTDLQPGSEAFYQEVNRVFTNVIDQTQVVDGVLQRSQVMRSPSNLSKQLTAFMGEPIKSLNMLYRATSDFHQAKGAQKITAAKVLTRAAGVLVLNDLVQAFIQSLVDAWRHDDRDKKYWERFLQEFTGITGEEETWTDILKDIMFEGNLGENLNYVNKMPYVKDVISIARGYDVNRADMDVVNGIRDAAFNVYNAFSGNSKQTINSTLYTLAANASKMFGISVPNVIRDVKGLILMGATETDNLALHYEMDKFEYDIRNKKNRSMFAKYLTDADKAGDTDLFNKIYNDLLDAGYTDAEIRKIMNDAQEDGSQWLNASEQKAYDQTMDIFQSSGQWSSAGEETKSWAEDLAMDRATQNEESVKLDDKIDEYIAITGNSETDFLLNQLAYQMAKEKQEEVKDDDGKKLLNSTGVYYDAIYDAYTSDSANYDQIYDNMIDAGFTNDQIKSGMENRMKEDQGVDSVYDLDHRWLNPTDQREYDVLEGNISGTSTFNMFDEDGQNYVLNDLYNLVTENSTGQKLQDKIDEAAYYGVDSTEYLLARLAHHALVSDYDENGNYTKQKKVKFQEWLNATNDIDESDKDYVWSLWYGGKRN